MNTLLILLSSLTIIIHTIYITLALDIITKTQFLKENDTIISPEGTFEMGFFSPGKSKNWYIGIWYKFSVETVVWVANRENPIKDKRGAALKITDEGVLVLFNATKHIIWFSPNISNSRSSSILYPIAQLIETGNLVIRDEYDSNFENFIWQSFDHPSDTQLPGMKLSYSFKTGVERYLTTWKSSDDPGPGEYTYHLDPNGYPQLVIRRGREKKHGSGPWVGDHFSGRPSSVFKTPATIYTRGLNLDEEEFSYTYDLIDGSVIMRSVLNQSVHKRWILINRTLGWSCYLFAPSDECDEYSKCGPNGLCKSTTLPLCVCLNKFVPRFPENWNMGDWSGGCVRKTSLNCERGDKFLTTKHVKLPDTNSSWYNKSMSLMECKAKCLKNCSCSAYSNLDFRDGGSGCLLWFSDLIDMRDMGDAGQEMYVRVASSELDDSNLKEKVTIAMILVGVVLLGLSLSLYVCRKKAKLKIEKESALDHSKNGSQNEDLEVPFFGLSTIAKATNNFSIDNKLGEGGFGPVYKGVLEEGQEIAVKRLSKTSRQGFHEFKNEVVCIAKLQHRNLVKLLGYCIQEDEYMLIYEYMPNNNLETFLFDETQRKILLDWPKRFHIINGIARGLLYLHQDSRLRVIHRDLKASNVLLDFEMNPKISDFGLARCFGGNETEANTRRVVGTFGYMPPEYAADGLFSVKSDVFSFGVLVLEILSGKRNRGFAHKDYRHNLLGHAWVLHLEGKSLELMDETLDTLEECYISEVLRSIQVGLLCVQQNPEDRPNMTSVVLMLGSEGPLPQPKQPGFFTERIVSGETSSSYSKAPISWSINGR